MIEVHAEFPQREVIQANAVVDNEEKTVSEVIISAKPEITGVTASVDNETGIPYVDVTETGTGTEFSFDLAFHNLKGEQGEQGIQGETGAPGQDGADGQDGFSPSATVEETETGATITIVDKDGTTTANILNGQDGTDGTDGADGQAATITVGSTTTGQPGTSASVVNSGTSSAAILDFTIPRGETGATGAPGQDGADGADGADGFSPIATVAQSGDVTTISITDKNGTTTESINLSYKQDKLTAGNNIELLPKLDMIKNTSNTRIDTGILVQTDNIEMDIVFYCNTTGSYYIFQSRDVGNNIFGISGSTNGGTILMAAGGKNISSSITRTIGHTYHVNAKFNNGNATLYVKDLTGNEEATTTNTYTFAASASNLMLFGNINNTVIAGNGILSAYAKINNEYIMDYIPVLYNSQPYFYDKVSGQFKTAYTGSLTAGKIVSGNLIQASVSGGSATDVQINGTSITSSGVANILTNTAYNSSTNKIATMSDIPGDEIFVAEYGVTSFNDIVAAFNAGKIIYCLRNLSSTEALFYNLTVCNKNSNNEITSFYFYRASSGSNTYVYVNYSDTWGYGSYNFVTTSSDQVASSRFDSQWTWKYQSVESGSDKAVGSYSYALSSYLPDTTNKYEVFVRTRAEYSASASIYAMGTVASPADNMSSSGQYFFQAYVAQYSRVAASSFILPFNANGTLYYQVKTAKIGGLYIDLCGYRRIGTNS